MYFFPECYYSRIITFEEITFREIFSRNVIIQIMNVNECKSGERWNVPINKAKPS